MEEGTFELQEVAPPGFHYRVVTTFKVYWIEVPKLPAYRLGGYLAVTMCLSSRYNNG